VYLPFSASPFWSLSLRLLLFLFDSLPLCLNMFASNLPVKLPPRRRCPTLIFRMFLRLCTVYMLYSHSREVWEALPDVRAAAHFGAHYARFYIERGNYKAALRTVRYTEKFL